MQAKASHFRGQRKFGRSLQDASGEVTIWLRASSKAGDFTAPGGEPKAAPARRPLA